MFIIEEGASPIYLRLADAIKASIERGDLAPGEQLPTVRELSALQGIAGGTIRHAYDHLVREGWLSMAQGKGTFVREASPSRQRQAMDAIGLLLDELTGLNFSTREIQMFFALKLGERDPVVILTPVAIVDCNPEALSEAVGQLSSLAGIELSEYLLEDVRRAPEGVFARYPLIITTPTHYHELCSILGDLANRVMRVVLTPTQQTVISLARIDAGGVGIYTSSPRFSEIIKCAMRGYPHLRPSETPVLRANTGESLHTFLTGKHTLLVSPDYLSYTSAKGQAALREFSERGGNIIPYHYRIDQGSYLAIEERVQELTRKSASEKG